MAVLGAVVLVASHLASSGCFPLCVLYNDNNPEWYLFFCYLC
jgi:hypothetical protein